MVGYRIDKPKFLIVDDSRLMRRVLRNVLWSLGARNVEEASTDLAAWDLLFGFQPDLVLLDWELGGRDGLAFVQRVRTDRRSPDRFLPIILVTGHTEVSRVVQARDAGVTEYLAKPFTAQRLYGRIKALIEHPRLFVDTETFFGPDRRRRGSRPWTGQDRRTNGQPEVDDLLFI